MLLDKILLVFTISGALCKSIVINTEPIKGRSPKMFGQVYTKTVVETKALTTVVPSSCVLVEPTLPPCRSVRYLKFPNLQSFYNNHLANHTTPTNGTNQLVHSTEWTWGEYLGLFAPTVTVTQTQIQVTTVQDPSIGVTFAIKGCRPLKLPVDMDRCAIEPSTVQQQVQATDLGDNINGIEISPAGVVNVVSQQPTPGLEASASHMVMDNGGGAQATEELMRNRSWNK